MSAATRSLPDRLRLIGFVAENVKRIKLVEIKPRSRVVPISGANGSGKSSLIDSLEYGLAGGRVLPSRPVREGEDVSRVLIDLGAIRVRWEYENANVERDGDDAEPKRRLVVENAKGARFTAPQRILDELWDAGAIDPSKFEGLPPKEQLEVLRRVVDIDIDIDELDGQIANDFETRTGVGREVRDLEARVAAFLIGPEWPTEAIDLSAVARELQAAGEHNRKVEQERAFRQQQSAALQRLRDEASDARTRAEALRAEAAELDRRAAALDASADSQEAEALTQSPIPGIIDLEPIRARIENAESHNNKVRQYREYATLHTQWKAKEAEHEDLTNRIERARAERAAAIARAKWPVTGLSFGEGEVLLNGLPLNQASQAERIRVCLGIAFAQNPRIRLVLMRNASLLDDQSFAVVEQMAEEHDYTVLCEVVDTSGHVGVYLEEGAVKAVDPRIAEALL